jgi:hypothetical protein
MDKVHVTVKRVFNARTALKRAKDALRAAEDELMEAMAERERATMACMVLKVAAMRLNGGDDENTLRVVFSCNVSKSDALSVATLLDKNGYSVKWDVDVYIGQYAWCDYWCVDYRDIKEVPMYSGRMVCYENVGGRILDIARKGVESVEDDLEIVNDD